MKKSRFVYRLIGGVLMLLIPGFVAMLLWNWLMPMIFGLTALNFWQAIGLLLLSRIFFGRLGGAREMLHRGMGKGRHSGNPLHEKWKTMTPEERAEFLNKRREHWGSKPGHHHFHGDREAVDQDKSSTTTND